MFSTAYAGEPLAAYGLRRERIFEVVAFSWRLAIVLFVCNVSAILPKLKGGSSHVGNSLTA